MKSHSQIFEIQNSGMKSHSQIFEIQNQVLNFQKMKFSLLKLGKISTLILKMNLSQTLSTFDSLQLSWGFFFTGNEFSNLSRRREIENLSQKLKISLAGNEFSNLSRRK